MHGSNKMTREKQLGCVFDNLLEKVLFLGNAYFSKYRNISWSNQHELQEIIEEFLKLFAM